MSSEATSTCEPGGCNGEPVPRRAAELTRIELDILHMLGRGLTNQEIADNLDMNIGTVRWRLNRLFRKLHARNRIEALARAWVVPMPAAASIPPPRRRLAPEALGKTQIAILDLLKHGMTNQEIADRYSVSPFTVKTHVNRAMAKLGARDRAQLVIAAYESGLVQVRNGSTGL